MRWPSMSLLSEIWSLAWLFQTFLTGYLCKSLPSEFHVPQTMFIHLKFHNNKGTARCSGIFHFVVLRRSANISLQSMLVLCGPWTVGREHRLVETKRSPYRFLRVPKGLVKKCRSMQTYRYESTLTIGCPSSKKVTSNNLVEFVTLRHDHFSQASSVFPVNFLSFQYRKLSIFT